MDAPFIKKGSAQNVCNPHKRKLINFGYRNYSHDSLNPDPIKYKTILQIHKKAKNSNPKSEQTVKTSSINFT